MMQFYALDARLSGIRYALFELADQLLAAICLARLGISGQEEELFAGSTRVRGWFRRRVGMRDCAPAWFRLVVGK